MDTGRSRCCQRSFYCCLVYLLLRTLGVSLGQFVPNSAVQQQTGTQHRPRGAEGSASMVKNHVPSITPRVTGGTAFGIRPLVGHTVATATGAVRGAASRVGSAIGAAVAASGMIRPSSKYAFERSRFQKTLADYPVSAPYSTPGSLAAVSHISAVPQAAHAPAATASYEGNESHLWGMEQPLSFSNPLSSSHQPPIAASFPAGAVYSAVGSGGVAPPTVATDVSLPHPLSMQHLLNHPDISLLPASPLLLQSAPSTPAFAPAAPGGLLPVTANILEALEPGTAPESGRLTDMAGLVAAAWPPVGVHAVQSIPGLSSSPAQATQQGVSGIPSSLPARQPISFYDALSLAEKVVVPSIEAIAKVAPALPLSREGEKLRGRLYNRTDEVAPDLNAPPAKATQPMKTERRPRLYIPQVQAIQHQAA